MSNLYGQPPILTYGRRVVKITPAPMSETVWNAPYPTIGITGEPVSPQLTVTLSEADFPTANIPGAFWYNMGCAWFAGQNTAAVSTNLICKLTKNGATIGTQTSLSLTAGQYYTIALSRAGGVKPGDVLGIKIWCSPANAITVQWAGFGVMPSRIMPYARQNQVMLNVKYGVTPASGGQLWPNLVAPGAKISTAGVLPWYTMDPLTSTIINLTTADANYKVFVGNGVYGFGQSYGDLMTSSDAQRDTVYPVYRQMVIPQLEYTPLPLYV